MIELLIFLGTGAISGAFAFLWYVGAMTAIEGVHRREYPLAFCGLGLAAGLTVVSAALFWRLIT